MQQHDNAMHYSNKSLLVLNHESILEFTFDHNTVLLLLLLLSVDTYIVVIINNIYRTQNPA